MCLERLVYSQRKLDSTTAATRCPKRLLHSPSLPDRADSESNFLMFEAARAINESFLSSPQNGPYAKLSRNLTGA